LVHNPHDGLLYAALSTADSIAVIDSRTRPARVVARIASGPFPQALAVTPRGEVVVACRYEPTLGLIPPHPQTLPAAQRYARVPAGEVHGLHGLALSPAGDLAYVATPALDGVQVVRLPEGGVVQRLVTGRGPRALRRVSRPPHGPGHEPDAARPHDAAAPSELLVVAHLNGRELTAHQVLSDGRLGPAVQRIPTAAPVQDLLAVPLPSPTLLLLGHEDRRVDRTQPFVAGLDSVVLHLPLRAGAGLALDDPGPGQRRSVNLTERAGLAKLDAAVYDEARHRLVLAGAATDNLLVVDGDALAGGAAADSRAAQPAGRVLAVGSNPTALALLPDGRIAVAERLSDTVTLVDPVTAARESVLVGQPERRTPAERGELLFFSRRLFPHNVADGERSVYGCSACHDDGRAHPARQNRFFTQTRTCRGIAQTAPYLFIGELADLEAFSASLVASHAQGWERDPWNFDKYPVTLPAYGRRQRVTLQPAAVRAAMAAYLKSLPPEPSPLVPLGATTLPAPARAGLVVFRARCASCHRLVRDSRTGQPVAESELERELLRGGVALTSPQRYRVGPPDLTPSGNNPPSLRGVWDSGPYFSDGSAGSLADVLRRTHADPSAPAVHAAANAWPAPSLSAAEREALLAFLRCL
jgi:mono/diheme cytochrome c family protein